MRKSVALVASLGCLVTASPALAGGDASGSARITAIVPEVCAISAEQFVLTAEGQVAGSVQEFCNSNTQYQVIATHRPLDSVESAQVQYGSIARDLDRSGLSLVALRAGQRIETVSVVINARAILAPLAVAFTMSAV
jgi:hypothetical protein